MMEPLRIWNPPNPYLTEHRELLGEPPAAELEVYEDQSRSMLSENDSPDIGFRWSVNPYRGCFHACAYCYARPTHEYFGFGAGTDFERRIFVKRRAPTLLEQAFLRGSWKGERGMFSGVTDCYQPLEASWTLTRQCLEVCRRFRNPVGIITKSLLIRRDAELLAALAREADARIFLSIPFLDERIARLIEPGAPTIRRRFETMRILTDAGVPVGIGVAPVIPGLNDQAIPGLLREAKRCGATAAFMTLLRLPGSVKAVFFHRLREVLPMQAGRIEHRIREVREGRLSDSRFGHRHSGSGRYWDMIEQMWRLWTDRLGFSNEADQPRRSTFRRPVESAQQREFVWAPSDLDPAVGPRPWAPLAVPARGVGRDVRPTRGVGAGATGLPVGLHEPEDRSSGLADHCETPERRGLSLQSREADVILRLIVPTDVR